MACARFPLGLRLALSPVATASEEETVQRNLDIFIEELMADEEFRDSFFRNPFRTLRQAADWGLPISESEIRALIAANPAVWERVADEVESRLQLAA
jgi:hypothetical protein